MPTESVAYQKALSFAKRIVDLSRHLNSAHQEYVLSRQILRSGTSIGANIREAFFAHGKADFIAKLQIALKECSESEYWLELLIESGYCDDQAILGQCIEVKKLLIASINTAKGNEK